MEKKIQLYIVQDEFTWRPTQVPAIRYRPQVP